MLSAPYLKLHLSSIKIGQMCPILISQYLSNVSSLRSAFQEMFPKTLLVNHWYKTRLFGRTLFITLKMQKKNYWNKYLFLVCPNMPLNSE